MRDIAGKIQTSIVLGCAGLLAIAAPAFSQPVPKPKPAIERPHKNLTHRAERNKAARGERLVSMPVLHEPKRPTFGWPVLVREARKYMGTNPTQRSRLWCATFMNMVLAKAGYSGTNSDAARSFAQYGRRVSEPKVGAIAVLTRGKNGGHVGVVSGIDANGNPIIISGNHGAKVGEAVYPRTRVIAYVMPSESRGETTQVAERAPQSHLALDGRAAQARVAPDGGIDSPITELLAAIEAEQSKPERPRQIERKVEPPVARAAVRPTVPPSPHLTVQQTPEQPAQARRDLPLEPGLAKFLGIEERAQNPAPRVAPQREQRVEHDRAGRVADEQGLAALFARPL
jgi:uncharacterized protein (TIGR02594 family)